MSIASKFDSFFYLLENTDVLGAINKKEFPDAFHHFEAFGYKEFRQPNQLFDPIYYSSSNPDVADAINSGLFTHAFEHYQLYGETENRYPSPAFEGFDPEFYLLLNPDVDAAVKAGFFDSASAVKYLMFGFILGTIYAMLSDELVLRDYLKFMRDEQELVISNS